MNPQLSVRDLLRALFLLLLIITLVLIYTWTHNTPDQQPYYVRLFIRLGGMLLDGVSVAAVFAVGAGIGRTALTRVDWRGMSRLERLPIEALFGVGVISLSVLSLGLIGLLQREIFIVLLVALAVIFYRAILAWLMSWRDLVFAWRNPTPRTGIVIVLIGGLLLMAMAYAFAPPSAWDSMTYHLIAPQRYLADGKINAHADNFFMGLAQFTEMLYTLTIGISGRMSAAAPIHFGMGLLGLLTTMGIVRRRLGVRYGWIASLLLMSSYSLWLLMGWAYVDLTVMAMSAGTLALLLHWREKNQNLLLVAAGCLIGFAVSAKYVAGGMAVAMLIFVIIQQPKQFIRNGIMLGGAAVAVFALWMVKGMLLYGNPIYPYFFGGLMWDAGRTASFNLADSSLLATGQAWQLPILPFAATILGVHNGEGFSFTAGTWLLTLPFLLAFLWGRLDGDARQFARDCVIIALPMVAFWMITAATTGIGIQTRLALMLFPCVAALGAIVFYALDSLPRKPIYVGFMVRILFCFTLFFQLADTAKHVLNSDILPYTLGMIDQDEYLYVQMGAHYPALHELSAHVSADSQVRLMWEPRSFYCADAVRCVPDIMFDHWRRLFAETGDADSVFTQYQAMGDDYLLFYEGLYTLDSQTAANTDLNALFLPALEQHMTAIWSDGFYTLYAWK